MSEAASSGLLLYPGPREAVIWRLLGSWLEARIGGARGWVLGCLGSGAQLLNVRRQSWHAAKWG